jgi:hypothetical protein
MWFTVHVRRQDPQATVLTGIAERHFEKFKTVRLEQQEPGRVEQITWARGGKSNG